MRIQEMLSTHPRKPRMGVSQISSYIQTIFDCADACLSCADACLAEEQVQNLVRCIRLNQDCCEICEVTGKILSRQTELDSTVIRAQLQACAEACRACAAECDRHAKTHEHCRVCAEACRECEEACMEAMEKFPSLAGMA
jgi:hypothetical protein